MLALALGIIFFVVMYQRRVIRHQHEIKKINDQKQLELIQASIQGEEEERMRIASELHDDVGATLSSVRLFLHSAAQNDPDIINQSKELLDDSIRKVRNISHKLQPALLQQLGLQASLDSFAAMMSKSGNIKITYEGIALPRMDENIEMSIYRMVQELTSNIIRHAGATTIKIETLQQTDAFNTVLTHNGNGLTEEMYHEYIYKKGAIGLKNIVNRLKTINGTIEFTKTGDEYGIIIQTPLIHF